MTTPKSGARAHLERDPWFMEERALHAFLSQVSEAAGRIPTSRPPSGGEQAGYKMESDGTAVVVVEGALMKSVPWWYRAYDIAATAYPDIEAQVNAAAASPEVKRIRLDIYSHGGSSAGVKRTGDAIFAARKAKPVLARIDDMACSAAYWLASQASEISADPMATVGSIGTYLTFMDIERLAKNEGIDVKVFTSGPLKGAGVPGTRLTPEQEKDLEKWVLDLTEMFVADVARGRGLSVAKVKPWATGGTWLGAESKAMGLVDRVESHLEMQARAIEPTSVRRYSSTVAFVKPEDSAAGEGARPASESGDRAPEGETMNDAEKKALEEKAAADVRAERARMSGIQEAFGIKDPDLCKQALSEGWDLDKAWAAYGKKADAKLEAEQKARVESEKKLEASRKAALSGADPVPVGGKPGEAPVVEKDFMTLAREYAKEHKCSMVDAMRAVNNANPGLHEKSQRAWAERAPEVHAFKTSIGMKP